MKISQSILWVLALGLSISTIQAALEYRTNVNPALLYWQSYLSLPSLAQEDLKIYDNYITAPLDDTYQSVVMKFDSAFRLVRRATALQQPCDWGIDLADGPETLLPHLAKNKTVAVATRVRIRYFLGKGQENEAIQDLLGAYVLARRTATDGTLISFLVQLAMQNILYASIAENFHAFSPEGLTRLMAGIDSSPAPGTVRQSIMLGERPMLEWFPRKFETILEAHRGDEVKAMSEIRTLLATVASEGGDESEEVKLDRADQYLKAAGRTIHGLSALIRDSESWYTELELMDALPYDQYFPASKGFFDKVRNSDNPFVKTFLPAMEKSRPKEFLAQVYLEMLRAAVQYRLRGEEGLKSVRDPFGTGPFAFSRFEFKNENRGFMLQSGIAWDFPVKLIFVEKSGPPFRVIGVNPGSPIEPASAAP